VQRKSIGRKRRKGEVSDLVLPIDHTYDISSRKHIRFDLIDFEEKLQGGVNSQPICTSVIDG